MAVVAACTALFASLLVSGPTRAATLVIAPAADGFVDSTLPSAVYGTAQKLKVASLANGHEQRSYLTFDVAGVGTVTGAKLRLFAVDASDAAGVLSVAATGWSEANLNWLSAPPPAEPLGAIGAVTAKRWVEIDVGSVVTGPGQYGFVIHGASTDAAAFHSRQAAKPPILVVSYEPVPTPTPIPTETAVAVPTPAEPTATPTPTPTHAPTHASTSDPDPSAMPAAGPNRETCSGYPEPRVFLEAQDWWLPIPGIVTPTQGHVHLGMCFPVGQTVSGTIDFDLRIVLHDNLGVVSRVKMQDDKSTDHLIQVLNIPAPASGALVTWHRVSVDTTKMLDGVRLLRWYVDLIHANGNRQTARTGWPLRVENGLVDSNVGKPTNFKFSGWYQEGDGTEWGYLNADVDGVPLQPITSTWQPKVTISNSSGPGVTSWRVAIDPAFHAADPGTLVASGVGAFTGTITVDGSGLAPGQHRLVVITTTTIADEEHSGVSVVPFTVVAPTHHAQ